MTSPVPAPVKIDYPSSDGKPMAESDHQRIPLTYAVDALRIHFRDRDDVYVSGNLLIYYEEGNIGARVAPDVFVVLGVLNHDRSSYFLWQERKAPDFVMEITSRSTWREDQGLKRSLYRRMGVTEYWQYDPTGDYLQPRLQGLRLVGGEYEPMPRAELADGTLAMTSRVLGLDLRIAGGELRFHDVDTGQNVLTPEENHDARHRAEQERDQARQERERAERAWHREHQARRQAEQAQQREEQARRAAEARVAELEASLRREGRP